MNADARWVVDTNIVISALFFEETLPHAAFQFVLERGRILQSRATLLELHDVLRRKSLTIT
jgi:predicted nucleic acid-binding protein